MSSGNRLEGKTAILTGGASGIGEATSRLFVDQGARVVIVDIDDSKGNALEAELNQNGEVAMYRKLDVTQESRWIEVIDEMMVKWGRLDIVVNNSGVNVRKLPHELDLAEWQTVIDVNLTGVFLVSKAAYPEMVKRGGGKVINIGSMMSIFAHETLAPYAASKGGVVQFTKACASAWAKENIQVNTIMPGWIATDMTETLRINVPERYETIRARTPAQRWGRPDELAGTAVFLATSASDFVTGTAIPVDGGYSIQS